MPSKIKTIIDQIDSEALIMYAAIYDCPNNPQYTLFVAKYAVIAELTKELAALIGWHETDLLVPPLLLACMNKCLYAPVAPVGGTK